MLTLFEQVMGQNISRAFQKHKSKKTAPQLIRGSWQKQQTKQQPTAKVYNYNKQQTQDLDSYCIH